MHKRHSPCQSIALFIVTSLFFVQGGVGFQVESQESLQTAFDQHSAFTSVAVIDSDELLVRFESSDLVYSEIFIEKQPFLQISLAGESQLCEKGKPDLPMIARSIFVPDGFQATLDLVDATYIDLHGVQVAPSKGVVSRTVSMKSVPFNFDKTYEENQWYPKQIVRFGESYQIRNIHGQVVQFFPCQYNPVENRLRMYTEVVVRITFVEEFSDSSLRSSEPIESIDRAFYQIYQRRFLNAPAMQQYDPVLEDGGLLIITEDSFYEALHPFVSWKIKRGIPTWVLNVSETQNAAKPIKNVIQKYYDEHQISFVLLVGDAQQVATCHTTTGHASDPMYSYLAGNDHYPDVFIGRFSAQTLEEVQTQIDRTLAYEQSADPTKSWYHKAAGIASGESGEGGDDNESDYEHIRNIRKDLMNYTYTTVDELYDGDHGGSDEPGDPIPDDIDAILNEGRGVVTYCGHGSPFAWSTGDYTTSNVHDLVNTESLPFIWSVSCWSGDFEQQDTCFAEAWLRATHPSSGEPTGAIATFMSSSAQAWNPPMAAQDEMVDLLVESYENFIPRTFGGLCYSGCMLMNDEYGSSGYATTDTWHIFGDPTLQVRTDKPTALTVEHNPSISADAKSYIVHVEGCNPAVCTLSYLGQILGKQHTDANGDAVITLTEELPDRGMLDLVVTGYNAIPYQTTLPIDAENEPPQTPSKPQGKRILFTNRSYQFQTTATDPNGDLLYYQWDWGDGTVCTWIGPKASGELCKEEYTYDTSGLMSIRVRVKDAYNVTSEWSEPLRIPVISSFLQERTIFLDLLEQFFPRLYAFYSSFL